MSRNVYFAACTLDGYIAEPEEKLEWLTAFEGQGYAGDDDAPAALDGFPAFLEGIGALVMGSKTYEFIREHGQWPYADRPSWVLSSRELEPMEAAPDLRFASGDVAELDPEVKEAAGERDIWVVGGGDIASQYVEAGLLDTVEVTVVPITLGAGLPLFAKPLSEPMRLLEVTPFSSGMVSLRYEIPR